MTKVTNPTPEMAEVEREAIRDPRLTYDARGDIELHVVWSLKRGQPQIVAICSSTEIAERYRPYVEQHHKGIFYVELVYLDHAFGRRDVQSAIYRAALANPEPAHDHR